MAPAFNVSLLSVHLAHRSTSVAPVIKAFQSPIQELVSLVDWKIAIPASSTESAEHAEQDLPLPPTEPHVSAAILPTASAAATVLTHVTLVHLVSA